MEKENFTRQPQPSAPATDEMTEQELDETSGGIGIIVIGGSLGKISIGARLSRVALNPQPLPPIARR